MQPKAKKILVSMPLELRARVDEFKRESGMPYVEIVRRAIDQYVPKTFHEGESHVAGQ